MNGSINKFASSCDFNETLMQSRPSPSGVIVLQGRELDQLFYSADKGQEKTHFDSMLVRSEICDSVSCRNNTCCL